MITDKLKHELNEMLSLKRKPIIEGWTTQEKAEVIAGLVIDQKPQLLVEVGVFGGRSLFAQAFALRENGMGIIWGIDPWSLEAALEGDIGEANVQWWTQNVDLENIYLGFLNGVLEFKLTKYCRWIRERSEIACKMFASKSVDIVGIDGNHSELASCRDVQIWHQKLKPGGFMIADDVRWDTVTKSLKILQGLGYKPVIETMEFAIFRKPE